MKATALDYVSNITQDTIAPLGENTLQKKECMSSVGRMVNVATGVRLVCRGPQLIVVVIRIVKNVPPGRA